MLTNQEIKLIKDSVPFLRAHGKTLASTFYQTMFTNNPEVKKFFNMENQRSGKQPEALSQSILAAANNIDNLDAIRPAIQKIGEVHCRVGIKPEHYPIVGKNLLLALKSMLGEEADAAFMSAWEKAYAAISEVFIQTEQEIYAAHARAYSR